MNYRGSSSQERFVLDITKNKTNGYYVELGAFHSSQGSNTFFLEKDYNWNGVSFEITEERRKEFIENRSNPCMGDALKFDYIKYFKENNFPKQIDYLSIDVEGAEFEVIKSINFDKVYIDVIGFESNYNDTSMPIIKYLEERNYVVIHNSLDIFMIHKNSVFMKNKFQRIERKFFVYLVKKNKGYIALS